MTFFNRFIVWLFLSAITWTVWAQPTQDAPRIKELVKGNQESLAEFLMRFPSSFEAQVYYGLFLSALGGLIASWAYKWSTGQADGFKHFSLKYGVQQFMTVNGLCIGLIMLTGFQTDSGEFFGWLSVLSSGAISGWAGEVKVSWHKDQQPTNSGG